LADAIDRSFPNIKADGEREAPRLLKPRRCVAPLPPAEIGMDDQRASAARDFFTFGKMGDGSAC
jgi:hypothetical protein